MKTIKGDDGRYLIECPGCGSYHAFAVHERQSNGAIWTFNGSFESPTFKPSMLVTVKFTDPNTPEKICHSFVTDGKIKFLGDCTHELKGKTVDLPEIK